MSTFEFILIIVAVVAGFAISEILAAWGRLIRARASLRDSALYCCSSLVLFFLILRYVWLLWGLRDAEWAFYAFVLRLVPMLVLALAAHVIALTQDRVSDVTRSYFIHARPLYILMAVYFVLLIVADMASFSEYLGGNVRAGGMSLRPQAAIRLFEAAVVLALAHTRNRTFHFLVLLGLLLNLLVAGFVNLPQL